MKNNIFLNKEQISQFFKNNSSFIDVFFKLCNKVKEYFPNDEIFIDVSEENNILDYTCLLINVRQKKYQEDIEDLLEEIYKPFSHYFSHTENWILLTTDYQKPVLLK